MIPWGQMGPSSAMKHAKIFGETWLSPFLPKALSSKGNLFEEIAQKLHPFFILLCFIILLWEKNEMLLFFLNKP
jgi:hypothetical protein